jgi:HlyD family secretion protein
MSQTIFKPGQVEAEPRSSKRRARLRILIPLGLALAGGATALWYFGARPSPNQLSLSGRIEGYETDVGTKVAGRIESVTVREGAQVQKGEVLARLDDDELQAQLQGATARLAAAQQQVQNARLQIQVLENQIAEAQLRVQQSQGTTQGQVAQAEAQVAAAQAQLAQAQEGVTEAQAQLDLARQDQQRYNQLLDQGAVTQQRVDQANTTLRAAQATLNSRQAAVVAAQRQVTAAQGQLTQSQANSFNPEINSTQVERLQTQLQQARAQLATAQAQVADAQATQKNVQAQLNNLTVTSPIDGVVTARSVEPGVVVSSGRILLSVVDLNSVYLRGFIPEGDIGRVRVGQTAQVYLDSAPDQPLSAKVAAIDSEASFTPENIYFRKDRVQQVFGVRLTIDQPDGFAKPGMPADARIELQ